MNRFPMMACVIALAGILGSSAFAADVPAPVYKGPAPVYEAPAFSWTGFYLGINGGYGFGKSDWSSAATTGSIDPQGALVGVTFGYNWQTGSWVLGAEGDIDATWINNSITSGTGLCAGGTGCDTHNTWLGTARARVGYTFDRWMPYVTGGGAFGTIKMSPNTGGSEIDTKFGWAAGAGLEYAYKSAWSVKLEYLYTDLGTATCSASTCGVDTDVSYKANLVRAGLNYRF
jgi:outer membrane immunogenic protein